MNNRTPNDPYGEIEYHLLRLALLLVLLAKLYDFVKASANHIFS